MCLIKHMPWRIWECLGKWSHIPWPLNFDTRSRWVLNFTIQPLYLQVKTVSGHWIGCRVGLWFSFDSMHKVRCWNSAKLKMIIITITNKTVLVFVGFTGRVLGLYFQSGCGRLLPNPYQLPRHIAFSFHFIHQQHCRVLQLTVQLSYLCETQGTL